MTCQDHCNLPDEITEDLISQGMDYIPEMLRILINLATKSNTRPTCKQSRMSERPREGTTPMATSRRR